MSLALRTYCTLIKKRTKFQWALSSIIPNGVNYTFLNTAVKVTWIKSEVQSIIVQQRFSLLLCMISDSETSQTAIFKIVVRSNKVKMIKLQSKRQIKCSCTKVKYVGQIKLCLKIRGENQLQQIIFVHTIYINFKWHHHRIK